MNNIQVANKSALALAEFQTETGQILSAETVKNYLVNGNGNVTDQEVLMFIELCKAQHLNPFIREAYLIKFGSSPANIVVGKDVFVKRAHRNPDYEGMRAGIVVATKDGEIKEREGSLKTPGEELIGGWCEVYVKNKKHPIKSLVSLEEYSKSQATWKQMPMVMIRKCAIVTALREAFPEDLAGMYDSAEIKNAPDKLLEKEVKVGYATTGQKQGIMKLASMKGLYDYENPKDISKMQEFCESNGYCLKELKFDEVDIILDLLSKYEPKEEVVIDTEFKEVVEDDGQVTLEV
ncbi:phage recombination protein Bet [Romboutsia ilealis]|uniref:Phage recombination protein Bet n=1 Tax=Romboutsia faecis TaxID=2764597 RepID=A0ABR7JSU9_9FIRM|nr:phage recombination protein Bet [Romboutsia faecis]MBC5997949.1 phage recombination protein Bet [Romboutsia faecis]MRN25644.1 phage recombination protein Bet [Romboutsia ilealis]